MNTNNNPIENFIESHPFISLAIFLGMFILVGTLETHIG